MDTILIRVFPANKHTLEEYKQNMQRTTANQLQAGGESVKSTLPPPAAKQAAVTIEDWHVVTFRTAVDSEPAYKFVADSTGAVDGQAIKWHSTQIAFQHKDRLYVVSAGYLKERSGLVGPATNTFLASLHFSK
jgi:hypothetical protein